MHLIKQYTAFNNLFSNKCSTIKWHPFHLPIAARVLHWSSLQFAHTQKVKAQSWSGHGVNTFRKWSTSYIVSVIITKCSLYLIKRTFWFSQANLQVPTFNNINMGGNLREMSNKKQLLRRRMNMVPFMYTLWIELNKEELNTSINYNAVWWWFNWITDDHQVSFLHPLTCRKS